MGSSHPRTGLGGGNFAPRTGISMVKLRLGKTENLLCTPSSQLRRFCPPGDMCQFLETFLVVTTVRKGLPLMASSGRGQGCCWNIRQHPEQLPTTESSSPKCQQC